MNVNGVIFERVEIKAGGDVNISKGFFGRSKGKIVSDGSVCVQFISEGLVIAKKDIRIEDYVMNSEVISGKSIFVSGNGLIGGGKIKAVDLIGAKCLGNESKVATYVEVWFDSEYETKRTDLIHRLRLLVEELIKQSMLSGQVRELYNTFMGVDKEKVSVILKADAKKK